MRRGVYIAKRKLKTLSVIFQLDNFYVEIVYEKYRWVIKEIHSTSSMVMLSLYADVVPHNPSN